MVIISIGVLFIELEDGLGIERNWLNELNLRDWQSEVQFVLLITNVVVKGGDRDGDGSTVGYYLHHYHRIHLVVLHWRDIHQQSMTIVNQH